MQPPSGLVSRGRALARMGPVPGASPNVRSAPVTMTPDQRVDGMTIPENMADGLHVDSIGKAFGKRVVVKSVSLRLRRGEVVGLLGPNGAGKTTCFYMITGLIQPDYGSILLDGQDVTARPAIHRQFGHIAPSKIYGAVIGA